MLLTVAILLAASFGAGLWTATISRRAEDIVNKQALYVGEVANKYSQYLLDKGGEDVDFGIFWEVWDALEKQYVDSEKVSEKKLFYGALKGMVASVGDPYTIFMDPKVSKGFDDDLAGTFEGIGAEIGIKNDILTIIAPLPDMPAEKAGLKAGDQVFFIDDASTLDMSVDEAVNRIRGEKGTEVKLSVFREGFDDLRDFSITRGKIVVKSVTTKTLDNDIYYLRITNFNNDTEELFNRSVREILEGDYQGLIVDLRNNPGGYLDTAIEMASEWVEQGIIVTEKYSDDNKTEHLARGRARLSGFETVVLVNQGSASASEIVAGALQDYRQARVLGQQTFGKGSVQTLNKFGDGSSLKITVAKWLTPNNRSINDEGIMPDLLVDLTLEDYNNNEDPQLDAAKEVLEHWQEEGYFQEMILRYATGTEETASSTE